MHGGAPGEDEEFLDDSDAAYAIGRKVLEMLDRLRPIATISPGAVVRWTVKIDDVRFKITACVDTGGQ